VTLGACAQASGAELRNADVDAQVVGIADPRWPEALGLHPVLSPRFLPLMDRLPASACVLTTQELQGRSELSGRPQMVHPQAAWVMACLLSQCSVPLADAQVHPTARVARTAVIAKGVVIGPAVFVGAYAVIGEAGFGFAHDANGRVTHIPHRGGVHVAEGAYIGAHCTIDAGVLEPTRIGARARLDAHVHVGHNGEVGADAVLCAQTGLAGSVVIGAGAMLGGQVGVRDHVTIGAGARVGGKAGVIGDIAPGAVVAGYPAQDRGTWLRAMSSLYGRRPARRMVRS
jgi:UDP-3-O-[3-hydroxymyristoyl] glucosamine N-acyltransferase